MDTEKKKKIIVAVTAIVIGLLGFILGMLFGSCESSTLVSLATFVPCVGSLGANLDVDCENARVRGYEDTALIFNRSDIDWGTITTDASNPRIVKTLAVKEGAKPYVIYNPRVSPSAFNGTSATFDQEGNAYTKQVQFYFEGIGGAVSKDVIEPLKGGSYVVLLQRKDHRGDGSFQLVGYQGGLTSTAQVQDEETGYWLITMETSESFAEVSFFNTDYATSKTAFDTLLASV